VLCGKWLFRLDPDNGRRVSRAKIRLGIVTPPVYQDGLALVGSSRGGVHGLDPATGRVAWSQPLEANVLGAAAFAPERFCAVSDDHTLTTFYTGTGQVAWSNVLKKQPDAAPLVHKGIIYLGCNDFNLYAFKARTGERVWSSPCGAPIIKKPVVAQGKVFAIAYGGALHVLGLDKGQRLWQCENVERVLTTTPAHVYLLKKDRHIAVADIRTGKPVTRMDVRQYDFFVAEPEDGVFYLVDVRGNLVACADLKMSRARGSRK